MKKFIFTMFAMFVICMTASAQAQIKFDKTLHNFGTFAEKSGAQTYVFTFTNTGDKPLVINQVMASCSCTVPTYTKKPILPGEKGEIKVKYNGEGKFPGHFKKTVTVRTNGKPEMTRLYIEGDMTE